MKKIKFQKPEDYLDFLRRRLWWILIPFISVSMLMVAIVLRIPNIYRSETLILIEPQKIPETYVRSPLTIESAERLNALREQIFSRTNLLEIIKEFGLYEGVYSGLNNERKTDLMWKNIQVKIAQGRVPSFRISYDHESPVVAQMVTNKLASLSIGYDAKAREQRILGTTDFLYSEVNAVERDLKDYEDRIARFKKEHYHELPEQLMVNLRTLDRLQEQLKANTEALDRSETQRLLIEQQMAATLPKLEKNEPVTHPGGKELSPRSVVGEYAAKKAQLEKLRSKYTESHPDVIVLEKELERMEKDINFTQPEQNQDRGLISSGRTISDNPTYRNLVDQLNSVKTEIARRKEERSLILNEINVYTARTANTSKRELEIANIMRVYKNLEQQHESLLKKKQEAKLASNLETIQKGEQFRIQDPANLPENPVKPKRARLILLGVLVSLGLGLGLALIFELLREEIKNEAEVIDLLNLPVLAQIPEIVTKIDIGRRKLKTIGLAFVSILLVAGYTGLLGLLLSENKFSRIIMEHVNSFLI